jgi:hypothetical protein
MTRTSSFLPVFCAAGLVLGASLPSQQTAEGWQSSLQNLPAGSGNVLQTAAGLVAFDGLSLSLSNPGQAAQTLLQFAGPQFGSFTLAAGPQAVLFGESSGHGLWLVPLAGTAPSAPLATVLFNYDAVLLSPQRALVSAKTGGFSTPDNDLVVVDLGTGQTQQVASLPGASGPLAVAANGDVYYATASLAFPPPPGATSVLRLRRPVLDAAIANQTVLGAADAELVFAGLAAAGDLAFDDDGDLWFTDWWHGTVRELNDVAGPAPTLSPVALDYGSAGVSSSTLQFVAAAAAAVFEPFQPLGGSLLVHETDFGSTSRLRTVRSAPATLTSTVANPIPSGPFALVASGGPGQGIGVLAFATQAAAGTAPLLLPGFEAPLWWDQALLAGPVLVVVVFDGSGQAALPIQNPGFQPPLLATAQMAFVTPAGLLGATPALPLTIGQ